MGNAMVIVRNPEDLEAWQERINECKSSGMTVVEWCSVHGISEKTYYYWHRKLARLNTLKTEPQSSSFFEVSRKVRSATGVTATVHFDGMDADVYTGADEETLFALFRALKQC